MVEIRIAPTTPVTVLKPKRLIGVLEVPVGVLFREIVDNMLAVNADVQILVAYAVATAHVRGVAVVKDGRYQKLILIALTPVVDYVVA